MKYLFDEETDVETETRAARSARGQAPAETEITLGMRSILGIFFGLVLICGVFFGLGYSVGRGATAKSGSTAPLATSEAETSSETHLIKPSPEQSSGSESAAAPAATNTGAADETSSATAGTASARQPEAVVQTVAQEESPTAALVPARTAPDSGRTPAAVAVSRPVPVARTIPALATGSAAPAAAGGKTYMVQIAAVRLQEDAGVLVAALKKRGYSAIIRHEPQDQYLHVQVGPFETRGEANGMRSRLLSDGYNAVVK